MTYQISWYAKRTPGPGRRAHVGTDLRQIAQHQDRARQIAQHQARTIYEPR
jgi:hypothetical protein